MRLFDNKSGLGLAIVARIIRNMNGQLHVESNIHQGSKFSLKLTYPLVGSQESNANCTNVAPDLSKTELDDEKTPIKVLGSTTAYLASTNNYPKATERNDLVQIEKQRDASGVRSAEPKKKIRVLYAEVYTIYKS